MHRLFFKQALTGGQLAHGYVLTGTQLQSMYRFVLELAQWLNCQQNPAPDEACGLCNNCRWIAENRHPAVMTVSRATYLTDDMLKQAKNKALAASQIRAEQISQLIQALSHTSEFFRVVIFTDLEAVLPESLPPENLSEIVPTPADWPFEDKAMRLRPLQPHGFNATSANRFLKTLEEPPPRTMFVFLTDTADNLLETLVSRCQVLRFQTDGSSSSKPPTLPDNLQTALQLMLSQIETRASDPFTLAKQFNAFSQEYQADATEGLMQTLQAWQRYEHSRWLLNNTPEDPQYPQAAWQAYATRQKALEQAISYLNSKTNADQTLNQLFYGLLSSVAH